MSLPPLVAIAPTVAIIALVALMAALSIWDSLEEEAVRRIPVALAFLGASALLGAALLGDLVSGTRLIETTVLGVRSERGRTSHLDTADGSFPRLAFSLLTPPAPGPHRLLLTKGRGTLLAVDP